VHFPSKELHTNYTYIHTDQSHTPKWLLAVSKTFWHLYKM
jgi:hypothetical protein